MSDQPTVEHTTTEQPKAEQPKAPETPAAVKRIIRSRAAPRIDPQPLAATPAVERTPADLLAEAVETAGAETVPPQTKPDIVTAAKQTARPRIALSALRPSPGIMRPAGYGLGLAAAVCIGWLGASLSPLLQGRTASAFATVLPGVAAKSPAAADQPQPELRRLADDVRALRETVASLRTAVNQSKGDDGIKDLRQRVGVLGESVERLKQDAGVKLTQVATQLERIERADRDPTPKLVQIAERLDRMERQAAAAVTGSLPKETVAATPAAAAKQEASRHEKEVAEDKPASKALQGWVLRDIYQGIGLIESRRGLFEVSPGRTYAGIGRVQKFERRGKQWVVVTDKGFIPMN